MAELIDLIAMQDIHPDNGLNEIKFRDFERAGELDEGVLDRIVELSKKLTKLSVTQMDKTSFEN